MNDQLDSKGKLESSGQIQLVGFTIDDEPFGLDILAVQEINRMAKITKVPQTPEFVEGVINLRGTVIPVIDLRKKLGLPSKVHDKHTRIIVAEITTRTIGFVVDTVTEVIRIAKNLVDSLPELVSGKDQDYIRGVGKLDKRLLMLLDIDAMFSSSEQEQISETAST